jgi:hypothetical protein
MLPQFWFEQQSVFVLKSRVRARPVEALGAQPRHLVGGRELVNATLLEIVPPAGLNSINDFRRGSMRPGQSQIRVMASNFSVSS